MISYFTVLLSLASLGSVYAESNALVHPVKADRFACSSYYSNGNKSNRVVYYIKGKDDSSKEIKFNYGLYEENDYVSDTIDKVVYGSANEFISLSYEVDVDGFKYYSSDWNLAERKDYTRYVNEAEWSFMESNDDYVYKLRLRDNAKSYVVSLELGIPNEDGSVRSLGFTSRMKMNCRK